MSPFWRGIASIGQGWYDIMDSFFPRTKKSIRPKLGDFRDDAKALENDWQQVMNDCPVKFEEPDNET